MTAVVHQTRSAAPRVDTVKEGSDVERTNIQVALSFASIALRAAACGIDSGAGPRYRLPRFNSCIR